MKRICIIFIQIVIFAELLSFGEAGANEDFSGKWHVTAGNTRYTMDLTQRGHEIFGNMKAVNRDMNLPIIVYGSVNGRRISINANNRNFTITLQFEGTMIGKGSGRGISGSVTVNNRHNFKWYGLRYY
jgi:hypothetical protein